MKKSLGIVGTFGIAAISTIAVIGTKEGTVAQEREGKQIARGSTSATLETSYAVGVIRGWPVMIFVKEDTGSTNNPDRLSLHVSKGASRILSYNKIASAQEGEVLTFFKSSEFGTGWSNAYSTVAEEIVATNSLKNILNVPSKDMNSLPDGCNAAIGWLCYVPNGFWDTHSEPVSFSALSSLKGAWLYR